MKILSNIVNAVLWLVAIACVLVIIFFDSVLGVLANVPVSLDWLTKTIVFACGAVSVGVSGILLLLRKNALAKFVGAALIVLVIGAVIADVVLRFV